MDAEKFFGKVESNSLASAVNMSSRNTMYVYESVQTNDVDPSTVYYFYEKFSAEVKLQVLSKFSPHSYMVSDMYVSVPGDFLSYTSKAMMNLKSSGPWFLVLDDSCHRLFPFTFTCFLTTIRNMPYIID